MKSLEFRLRVYLVLIFVVMAVGTAGFTLVEGFTVLDAFYLTVVTVATVGYGDIHPVTPWGKVLAIALIVTGVGTFLGVIANATEIMLNRREAQLRFQKVHMAIGLFFSEIGTRLISYFSEFDPQLEELKESLVVTGAWSHDDFLLVKENLWNYSYKVDPHKGNWLELRRFLEKKSSLLLGLLESPYLLEHESFTELLQVVFHLREELLHRDDLEHSPDTDLAHLAADVQRAYALLVHQWVDHMEYLKGHYPYLFSFAMRSNPFDQRASTVVR